MVRRDRPSEYNVRSDTRQRSRAEANWKISVEGTFLAQSHQTNGDCAATIRFIKTTDGEEHEDRNMPTRIYLLYRMGL